MASKIFVIYHGDCADGYGAAWAAHRLFEDEATYIPGYPKSLGAEYPELAKIPDGAILYILDIGYPPVVLDALSARLEKITIVDHHQTAFEWYANYESPANVDIHLDGSRSAAVLAWQYFHKEKKIPEILLYIEDRDLWKWELPDSENVLAGLDAYPYTFRNLSALANDMDRLKMEGRAITKWRNQLIDLQLKSAHKIVLGAHTVPAVNCSIRALVSETGHELLRRMPEAQFVALYRRAADGTWDYSLRGRGDFDVAAFAQEFAGGGGHRDAAGMNTKNPPELAREN